MGTHAMTDIVAFLTAQLDEDEQLACDADADWTATSPDLPRGTHLVYGLERVGYGLSYQTFAGAWEPARVLTELAAKRRILELHQFSSRPERWGDLRWPADADTPAARDRAYGELTGGAVYSCATCDGFDREEERVVRADPWCDTLLALVAPCADRPGYDESWRT